MLGHRPQPIPRSKRRSGWRHAFGVEHRRRERAKLLQRFLVQPIQEVSMASRPSGELAPVRDVGDRPAVHRPDEALGDAMWRTTDPMIAITRR